MKTRSFFTRLWRCPIPRRALVTLCAMVALAKGSPAFSGEIHDAAKNGDVAKVRALLTGNPALVSSKDYNDNTPLHWAARENHKDMAEFLLAHHAEVNVKDGNDQTPLHEAAYRGDIVVAELLLAYHAEVNTRNDSGETPLHRAAGEGRTDAARLFLENGAQIEAKDTNGETPLFIATSDGHEDVVKLLLANRANVNAKNNKGATPLHRAASAGHENLVELLLAYHADVNAKDNSGATPLQLAETSDQEDVAELLRRHGGQDTTTILPAIPATGRPVGPAPTTPASRLRWRSSTATWQRSKRSSKTILSWFRSKTRRDRRPCTGPQRKITKTRRNSCWLTTPRSTPGITEALPPCTWRHRLIPGRSS